MITFKDDIEQNFAKRRISDWPKRIFSCAAELSTEKELNEMVLSSLTLLRSVEKFVQIKSKFSYKRLIDCTKNAEVLHSKKGSPKVSDLEPRVYKSEFYQSLLTYMIHQYFQSEYFAIWYENEISSIEAESRGDMLSITYAQLRRAADTNEYSGKETNKECDFLAFHEDSYREKIFDELSILPLLALPNKNLLHTLRSIEKSEASRIMTCSSWLFSFLHLAHNLPVSICLLAENKCASKFRFVYANRHYGKITQYDPKSVLGKNCWFLDFRNNFADTPPCHIANNRAGVKALGKSIKRREQCHVTLADLKQDGSQFLNLVHTKPLVNKTGKCIYVVAVQLDVSDPSYRSICVDCSYKMQAIREMLDAIGDEL